MKIAKTVWLVIAILLIVLGAAIFAGVMVAYDWDFTKLGTVPYETNTYGVDGDFDSLSIDVKTTDISFVLTNQDTCSIVCRETEKVWHAATVQSGTLSISTVDTRQWYDHIGIFTDAPEMVVFLPKNTYADLLIQTDTGDIHIPKEFTFSTITIEGDTADVTCLASGKQVEIEVDTGDIAVSGITAETMELATTSGNIALQGVTVQKNIELETNTGKTRLTDVQCADLQATADTGDVRLDRVRAEKNIAVETDTGDVLFDHADGATIMVETDTGDVKGSLLSDKVFISESRTGRVSVPRPGIGGTCTVTTNTGDIVLTVAV